MYKKIIFSVLTVGVAALLGACASDNADQSTVDNDPQFISTNIATENVTIDPSAVRFAAHDVDGNLRESSEWLGKQPLVINFWGTWCPPCRKEIPELVRLYDEYNKKGVEMVSFALMDTPAKVKSYATRNNMKWVMLLGDQKIAIDYGGITGVPTTIFLDRNGRELKRFVGPRSYEVFKKEFDRILEAT